jgi:hypothetical protein
MEAIETLSVDSHDTHQVVDVTGQVVDSLRPNQLRCRQLIHL